MATILAIMGHERNRTLAGHPHIKRFLRGTSLINPPQVHRFLTRTLNLVLQALTEAPLEWMASCYMKAFSKLFLVAITLACGVSELGALSVDKELCIFYNDMVVLRPGPAFIPKINTSFHRTLRLFCPPFLRNQNTPRRGSCTV